MDVAHAAAVSVYAPSSGAINPSSAFSGASAVFLSSLYLLAGLAAVFFLIYYGIQYITSGGSADKTKAARAGIVNAVIGIAIITASYGIINIASSGSLVFSSLLKGAGVVKEGTANNGTSPTPGPSGSPGASPSASPGASPDIKAKQHASDILNHYQPKAINGKTKECYDGDQGRCMTISVFNSYRTCLNGVSSESDISMCTDQARVIACYEGGDQDPECYL